MCLSAWQVWGTFGPASVTKLQVLSSLVSNIWMGKGSPSWWNRNYLIAEDIKGEAGNAARDIAQWKRICLPCRSFLVQYLTSFSEAQKESCLEPWGQTASQVDQLAWLTVRLCTYYTFKAPLKYFLLKNLGNWSLSLAVLHCPAPLRNYNSHDSWEGGNVHSMSFKCMLSSQP